MSLRDVSVESRWDDDPSWPEYDPVWPSTFEDDPLGSSELKDPDSLDDIVEESAWFKDPCSPEELEILPASLDDTGPLFKEPEMEEEYEEDWAEAKEDLPS